jgi:CheY-like chemotaxis protein
MLLRITKRPSGTFDGVPLGHYQVGSIYEVGPQICGVLLLEGCAEPATYDSAGRVEPVVRPPAVPEAPIVLVVDDEPEIRTLAQRALTAHGYHVHVAPNGRDALRRLKEAAPDVILLDLNMPVMDGWQFRAEQKRLADERLAEIPVVLLTGDDDAAHHATRLQAVAVLKKPFDLAALVNAIRTVISRGNGRSPAF